MQLFGNLVRTGAGRGCLLSSMVSPCYGRCAKRWRCAVVTTDRRVRRVEDVELGKRLTSSFLHNSEQLPRPVYQQVAPRFADLPPFCGP